MDASPHTRTSRWVRLPFWILLICALGAPGRAFAENEATIKAAYILNFAKLVEWPAGVFAPGQNFVIGVVGRNAVGDELARTLPKASVGGRRIEVRRVDPGDGAALAVCHLLFIGAAERNEAMLTISQEAPVLLVGEAQEFARHGGAMGFVLEEGTVKFEANPKAAARRGLTISAKLLRVAREVINR